MAEIENRPTARMAIGSLEWVAEEIDEVKTEIKRLISGDDVPELVVQEALDVAFSAAGAAAVVIYSTTPAMTGREVENAINEWFDKQYKRGHNSRYLELFVENIFHRTASNFGKYSAAAAEHETNILVPEDGSLSDLYFEALATGSSRKVG